MQCNASCDVWLGKNEFLAGLVTIGWSATELVTVSEISKHEQTNRPRPSHHARVGSTIVAQSGNMIQRWNAENLHSVAIAYLWISLVSKLKKNINLQTIITMGEANNTGWESSGGFVAVSGSWNRGRKVTIHISRFWIHQNQIFGNLHWIWCKNQSKELLCQVEKKESWE